MVEKVIFAIWALAPVLYLLFALRALLERVSNSKDSHPTEYLVSAAFLAVVGGVSYLVHLFWLDGIVSLMPFTLPRIVYLIALWPFFLFVGAKILGPSRDIVIGSAPNLHSQRGRPKS